MRHLLRSVWDEPRPPDPPRRMWWDRVLVGVFVGLVVLEGLVRPNLPHRVLWMAVAVAIMPTLLWRRTKPLEVVTFAFVASAAGTVLAGGEQSGLRSLVVMLLLPLALVRWGSGREVLLGSVVVLVSAVFSMAVSDLAAADVVGGLIVLFAVVALGLALRYRARAKARELDQVKLLERERLARDLHDSVAHHVSAMVIRAQAGMVTAASSPDAAMDALRLIEVEATRALGEMRAMVHMLRSDRPVHDGDLSPGVGDVDSLARNARHGPSVDVEITGDIADLPAAVDTAIYRLAQESVTNALRHARNATRVQVCVDADDTAVRLLVRDDGDPVRGSVFLGYGLLGMSERAALLGGTCEAGPHPGRGWRVSAVLPRASATSRGR
ncbi:sensor histidine kinase [Nocardia sp. CA-135953]|uniref:sensor histidine kinase n=1 Tax=Nocardia sp. CA-135953 TaxID=3239978 RepID=UPI003D997BAF